MESYILDWLYLITRWAHIITAIAWIGASFYFVWLDNHLEKPHTQNLIDRGVHGELWAVHGGGFYNSHKYLLAPKTLPKNLHWFYWESYGTWMSGFGLFLLVYLLNAKAFLIDPTLFPMTVTQAVVIALSLLVFSWVIYDMICRLFIDRSRILNLSIIIYIIILSIVSCHLFPGRAAFLITGASMATIMSANVLVWIIPGQRKVLAAMKAGDAPNPRYGQRGKQRSVHNTYFTLPVLFCMISNHFSFLSLHEYNWLALLFMMAAGVLIRQYFIMRHRSINRWELIVLALIAIVLVMILVRPREITTGSMTSLPGSVVSNSAITEIIHKRCYGCHAKQPELIPSPPKGISFESYADINRYAVQIFIQTCQNKAMPLGNITKMTQEERDVIAAWYHTIRQHESGKESP